MTLLLISPKDLEEALAALRGGADILDVKNPNEGSLGASFPWVIEEVRKGIPPHIPISAAIGDFPDLPGSASLAALGALKAGADIIKVGLKGPKDVERAIFLMKQVVKAVKDASRSAKVVACAYGDFERAKTLDPKFLPEIASKAGADVAMIDTAVKDGKPLTHFMSLSELERFIEDSRSLGLWTAIGGSLGFEEVRAIRALNPNVIGVRGAVCKGGDRKTGRVSEELVRQLKKMIEV